MRRIVSLTSGWCFQNTGSVFPRRFGGLILVRRRGRGIGPKVVRMVCRAPVVGCWRCKALDPIDPRLVTFEIGELRVHLNVPPPDKGHWKIRIDEMSVGLAGNRGRKKHQVPRDACL